MQENSKLKNQNSKFKFKSKKLIFFTIFFVSVIFAGWQMIYLAKNQSLTTDEKVHAPAGFSYWKFDNYYLNPEHPPLAKLLVGLPVYLARPYFPATDQLFNVASRFYYDSWSETRQWGEKFFYSTTNNVENIIFHARAVNIVLAVCLIIFLVFWGYQIGGLKAATLVAILASFTPLILGHGSLANTDLLITLNVALLSYFWWRYLGEKSWLWFFASAFTFGLCAVTKFSFVALIPFLFFTSLIVAIKEKSIKFWSALLKGLILAVVSWFVIMAFYGFSFETAPPFEGFMQKGIMLNALAINVMKLFGKFMVPVWYFKGLFMVLGGAIGGRSAYLLGDFNGIGWWYYFPITIVLKTPISFLVLLIWSLAKIKEFFKKDFALQAVLVGGASIYLLVAMASKTNLGQRHIMPIYPLLIIFISQLVLTVKVKWQSAVLSILVLGNVISVAASYKNQIGYFNEFVGQKDGYKYLLDSNYDWGQGLTSIRDYLKNRTFGERVYVEYEWSSPGEQEYYGILNEDLKTFDANRDSIIIISPGAYMDLQRSWVRNLPIIDRIDNTIFVLRYNKNGS